MPRSITPLLADQLDISEERAQSLLESMVQELRHRAEDEGVQLSGLGTFRHEDGALTFVPSSSLRRRVNHQFEGLSEEDLSAPDDPSPPPPLRESSDVEEAPDTASTPETSEDDSIPTIDPVEEAAQQGADEGEGSPTAPSGPDESASEDGSTDESTDDESTEPEASEPDATERPVGPVPVAAGLLLVLVLVGGLWVMMSDSALWSSGAEETPYGSTDPQTTQSENGPSNAPKEESPSEGSESSDQQTDRFAGVESGDEGAASDADAQSRRWVIVVASQSDRSSAEDVARKYEGGFASPDIVPATTNAGTRYRVTLGRYPSEAAARRALENHASDLPSGAWTHRLE